MSEKQKTAVTYSLPHFTGQLIIPQFIGSLLVSVHYVLLLLFFFNRKWFYKTFSILLCFIIIFIFFILFWFFILSDSLIFYSLSQQNEFSVFLWTKKRPGAFSFTTRQLVISRGSPADGAAVSGSLSGQSGFNADIHSGGAPGRWDVDWL